MKVRGKTFTTGILGNFIIYMLFCETKLSVIIYSRYYETNHFMRHMP